MLNIKLIFEGLGIPNPPAYIVAEHSCAASNCTTSENQPQLSHLQLSLALIFLLPSARYLSPLCILQILTAGMHVSAAYRCMSICNNSGIIPNVLASMYASTIATEMSQSKINSDHAHSLLHRKLLRSAAMVAKKSRQAITDSTVGDGEKCC